MKNINHTITLKKWLIANMITKYFCFVENYEKEWVHLAICYLISNKIPLSKHLLKTVRCIYFVRHGLHRLDIIKLEFLFVLIPFY